MQHLGYLKIANFIFAGCMAGISLLAVAMICVPLVAGLASGQMGASEMVIFIVTAAVAFVTLLLMAAFYAVLGKKVSRGRWRLVQTIAAVFSLGSFPIGTAYAIFALWVCWGNEETRAIFDEGGILE